MKTFYKLCIENSIVNNNTIDNDIGIRTAIVIIIFIATITTTTTDIDIIIAIDNDIGQFYCSCSWYAILQHTAIFTL